MQRSWQELAEISLSVAREASEIVRDGWRSRPQATEKTRSNLVTQYDLASERLIRERLARLAPGIAVVGEEGGGASDAQLTFYCDPLDGTTNFVHGHPFWCVSIGVLAAGVPVAGAVVAPSLATEWIGWQGGVPRRNDAACGVSSTDALRDALVATGFPTDRSRAPENNFDTFVRVKKAVRAVRRCGAAAIDMCFVADGTYDGYWERVVNAWDLAGGAAVLLAAGGRLTSLDGSPARLEHGNVLATNGHIHADLMHLLF
jgi:myo-inositol-1(or 4)-monophosphatase